MPPTETNNDESARGEFMVLPDAEWDSSWIAMCQEVEDSVGHVICGAPTTNGRPCRKRPTRGQVRCMEHLRAAHLRSPDGATHNLPTTRVAILEDTDLGVVERWRSTFEERMPAELRMHFEVMHNRTITAEMMVRELIGVQRARLHMALNAEAEIGILDPQVTAEVSLMARLVTDLGKVASSTTSTEGDNILALAKVAFTQDADFDDKFGALGDEEEE
jgi:hypothetical protein